MRVPTAQPERFPLVPEVEILPAAGATESSAEPAPASEARVPLTGRKLWEPHWDFAFLGLLGYIVVEYTRLPAMFPVLQPLALGKVTVVLSALGWVFLPKAHRFHQTWTRRIDTTLLVLLGATLVSAFFAEFPDPAWKAFLDAVRWGVVYFIISRLLVGGWRLRTFCFLWLLANLKLAQFVVRSYQSLHASGMYDEMQLITNGIGAGSTGFFSNSADLGVAMCVIWPVAVCLLFSKPRPIWKVLLWANAILCLGAILVCGSRGAVVGAAAVAVIAFFKSPKKAAALIMAVFLLIGIWLFLPAASKERFHSAENPDQDRTAHARLLLWKAGLRMFRDNPILGVGPNNYPLVRWNHYPLGDPKLPEGVTVPHSSYIEAISELGLSGSIPFLLLWVTFFQLNSATRRQVLSLGPEYKRSFEYCLAMGLDLGMIGYMGSGAFVAVLWYPHIFVLLGLSVGLYSVAMKKTAPTAAQERVRERPGAAWQVERRCGDT